MDGSSRDPFIVVFIYVVDTRMDPINELVIGSFGVMASDCIFALNLLGLSDNIETESSSAISLSSWSAVA